MELGWVPRATAQLRAAANADGGFGARPGQPSEAEPTALAALALDDGAGRAWLAAHQRADGAFDSVAGAFPSTAATALAALALAEGDSRRRALDALSALRAHPGTPTGWGWTAGTHGWVEPTSLALLALRVARPSAADAIADGDAVLASCECAGGGWNYGNRSVLGTDLKPYVQTSAVALLALQGADPALVGRARGFLLGHWPDEPGGLSAALTMAAFRVHGFPGRDVAAVGEMLGRRFDRTGFLDETVPLAWALLASGDGVASVKVTP